MAQLEVGENSGQGPNEFLGFFPFLLQDQSVHNVGLPDPH